MHKKWSQNRNQSAKSMRRVFNKINNNRGTENWYTIPHTEKETNKIMKWLPDVWVHSNVCGKCAQNERRKKYLAGFDVIWTQCLVKDSTDKTAATKKVRQANRNRDNKAYEFICVVSVKPMCRRPKFPKPHIYQSSIDCVRSAPVWIANSLRSMYGRACARIANDYLTTSCIPRPATPFDWHCVASFASRCEPKRKLARHSNGHISRAREMALIRNQVLSLSICGWFLQCYHKI